MASLNLPAKMDFTMGSTDMGSTEEKMDMSLDDIIKKNRKTKAQRLPNKGRFRNPNAPGQKTAYTPAARAAVQRSVAARSAHLRQGKLADVRGRGGAAKFPATQVAARRAFVAPMSVRNGAWMKARDVRRNNFIRQRYGPSPKSNAYGPAAGNMKISVVNNGSKNGGQRVPAAFIGRRNGGNVPSRQAQALPPNTERMDVDYPRNQFQRQKPRTLDSLFAEIKGRRNTQPVMVQAFTSVGRGSGRGGRNGYSGRRRQGQ